MVGRGGFIVANRGADILAKFKGGENPWGGVVYSEIPMGREPLGRGSIWRNSNGNLWFQIDFWPKKVRDE